MAEKDFNNAAPRGVNDNASKGVKPADGTYSLGEDSASYIFDYEKEVADFHKNFPHLKEKIYFIDMTPTSAKVVKGELEDVSKIDEEITKGFVANGIKKFQADDQSFTILRPNGYFIVLAQAAARRNLPRLLGHTATDDIENLNTFDHEIGHAVTRDGYNSSGTGGTIRESAADAYAAIRHIQRFGVDEWIKNLADLRAVELVFRPDMEYHFSSPVLNAVIEAAKTFDFKTLTPEQTVTAANNFAVSHTAHPRLLMEARDSFKHINGRLASVAKGDMGAVRDLALVVLSTESAGVFKWGAVALRAFMDGKVLVDGVQIKTKDKYWTDIRTALDRREQEHGKDNFFAPKKPKPAPLQPGVK